MAGVYKVVDFNQGFLPTILHVDVSEFGLIIMHTYPGQASGLAYFLDKKYINKDNAIKPNSGILGSIAGDDTILLIVRSKNDLSNVFAFLREDFPYLDEVMKS